MLFTNSSLSLTILIFFTAQQWRHPRRFLVFGFLQIEPALTTLETESVINLNSWFVWPIFSKIFLRPRWRFLVHAQPDNGLHPRQRFR